MKIMVVSSHTESLVWFRFDMLKKFLAEGHTVVAVGNENLEKWKNEFERYGIKYDSIYVSRNSINPFNDFHTLCSIYKIIKLHKPDKIFFYQAKTVIYGNIASRFCKIKDNYSLIAGLGSIFRDDNLKAKIIKFIMALEYKLALSFSKKVIFQNNDDLNEFVKLKIINREKTAIVNGSGVNLERFKPIENANVVPTFLFIGRLIKDKGLMEYLEACKMIKSEYPNSRCMLIGPFDSNPSAIKCADLNPYIENGLIEYFGEQKDVVPYLNQCNVFVLPSYHEGTPKSVLEAMACGKAIITTNAPGCRETVINGKNGFLIPIKNSCSLAETMKMFCNTPQLANKMGRISREIAEKKYDVNFVNSEILKIMDLGERKNELV